MVSLLHCYGASNANVVSIDVKDSKDNEEQYHDFIFCICIALHNQNVYNEMSINYVQSFKVSGKGIVQVSDTNVPKNDEWMNR